MIPERTPAQLRQHYLIERELADRLRRATKEERKILYGECYDELFRRVPDHPQLVRKADAVVQREAVAARAALVRVFLRPGATFMEIGPGDCSLAIEMCAVAARVFAIDVSAEITARAECPPNFALLLSDGASIPLPECTADVAFSYQLIEHLHPADALEHACEVHRTLVSGGVYVCVTPSRLNGPHDISRYFDDVATGFHMREYTNEELIALFRRAGFSRAYPLLGVSGRFYRLPPAPLVALERAIARVPGRARKRAALVPPFHRLLGVCVAAVK